MAAILGQEAIPTYDILVGHGCHIIAQSFGLWKIFIDMVTAMHFACYMKLLYEVSENMSQGLKHKINVFQTNKQFGTLK